MLQEVRQTRAFIIELLKLSNRCVGYQLDDTQTELIQCRAKVGNQKLVNLRHAFDLKRV